MTKKSGKKTQRKVDKAKTNDKESTSSENKGGVTVDTLDKQKGHRGAKVKPGKRLYLNAAKDTLYPEGHLKAASLYCTEHKEVPRKEFNALKKGK